MRFMRNLERTHLMCSYYIEAKRSEKTKFALIWRHQADAQ